MRDCWGCSHGASLVDEFLQEKKVECKEYNFAFKRMLLHWYDEKNYLYFKRLSLTSVVGSKCSQDPKSHIILCYEVICSLFLSSFSPKTKRGKTSYILIHSSLSRQHLHSEFWEIQKEHTVRHPTLNPTRTVQQYDAEESVELPLYLEPIYEE